MRQRFAGLTGSVQSVVMGDDTEADSMSKAGCVNRVAVFQQEVLWRCRAVVLGRMVALT
jgi:hypothetical protein